MSSISHDADVELFARLQQDDHAAYTEIYGKYSRLLFTHAYKKVGDRELSRDLVQDLFTTLWVKRQEIIIKTVPSAYLYTALRNRILDHIAHQNVSLGYAAYLENYTQGTNDLTDHLIRHKQLMQFIEQEIAALPEKMRQVFELSRKEHLSHKEIAVELGISEQTVRKQIQNALKIMRPKLSVLFVLVFLFEK
ncbi:ECF RNA polymerase sigma factor SigL [Pedobacter sp. Bi27]|uniref:RNA polymerase sigma-70 factor n=1 Tax=Pedobacter sp. Bi27 TaxID=2822351 RepID=UPI001D89B0D0|nr:RNA polymerase sigma-70 factor [Pedobacter sp. Bi27]CAH0266663.1 ECF RNA polymerase sigma factor SigL [Pedobacter sp. Bi27]